MMLLAETAIAALSPSVHSHSYPQCGKRDWSTTPSIKKPNKRGIFLWIPPCANNMNGPNLTTKIIHYIISRSFLESKSKIKSRKFLIKSLAQPTNLNCKLYTLGCDHGGIHVPQRLLVKCQFTIQELISPFFLVHKRRPWVIRLTTHNFVLFYPPTALLAGTKRMVLPPCLLPTSSNASLPLIMGLSLVSNQNFWYGMGCLCPNTYLNT